MRAQDILIAHHGVVRMVEHRTQRTSWWRGLQDGRLLQPLPGIVMDAGLAHDPRAWIRSVALWSPHAVIAGRAAAAMTFAPLIDVETVTVYARGRLPDRGPIRFRRSAIAPDFLDWSNGIRVTVPVATALTAGLENDFVPATTALRQRLISPADIAASAQRWSRHTAARARRVAEALSNNPWSPAEVDAHALFRRAGVRGWQGNPEVWLDGTRLVPDIGLIEARMAFEIDSFEFHSSNEAMERDAARKNRFLAAGWRSYALTPRQIRDHPEETAAFIRSVVWKRHLTLGPRRRTVAPPGL